MNFVSFYFSVLSVFCYVVLFILCCYVDCFTLATCTLGALFEHVERGSLNDNLLESLLFLCFNHRDETCCKLVAWVAQLISIFRISFARTFLAEARQRLLLLQTYIHTFIHDYICRVFRMLPSLPSRCAVFFPLGNLRLHA